MNLNKLLNGEAFTIYLEKTTIKEDRLFSLATQSFWDHEAIFLTTSNRFILRKWSNAEGSKMLCREIDSTKAIEWFASQRFKPEEVPSCLRTEQFLE